MRLSLSMTTAFVVLAACGGEPPTMQNTQPTRCECGVTVSGGRKFLPCGTSECVDGAGYLCSPQGMLLTMPSVCEAVKPQCTPKTCIDVGFTCGSASDGCGGTLSCGTCGANQQCTAGRCQVDVCGAQHAVCGTIQGQSCGTCPGTSTCSSDQQHCIEHIATLPFDRFSISAALAGDRVYVTGEPTANDPNKTLLEVTLSTGATRTILSGEPALSPLTTNATHLIFATGTGIKKLAFGSTQVDSITGMSGTCYSVLATAQRVFCSIAGNPRIGVSDLGIRSLPTGGGTWSWVDQGINFVAMARVENLLFSIGSTDNYASFKVVSVTDLNDMSGQSLASGGALDGSFMLADREAWYYVAQATSGTSGSELTRMPFDNSASQVMARSTSGFRQNLSLADVSDVYTVATVNGDSGLYRLPRSGTPTKLISLADLGGDAGNITAMFRTADGWVFVVGTQVLRVK